MAEENHELRRRLREREQQLEELEELRAAAAALRRRSRGKEEESAFAPCGRVPVGEDAEEPSWPPCGSPSRRQRLRYLYASPLQLPALDIDGELAALEGAAAGCFNLEAQVASITSLGQAALEPELWLHLTAHTARSGQCLALEDEDSLGEQERLLPLGGLQSYLQVGGGARCSFLFLSACESEHMAKVFHSCGVPNVVFCPTEVQDSRARRFACALYSAMAKRLPLNLAFLQASAAAKLGGDEARYGLLSSQDLEFRHQIPVSLSAERPRLPTRRSLRRKIEDFVGRRDVIRCALSYLNSKRSFVLLHCEDSLGRSATLREIAHLVTVPGRKFAGVGACAFFPGAAIGGLLVVDDVDALSEEEQEQVRQHLEVDGARLLAASRFGHSGRPFEDLCKTMPIELPPLREDEAAELFLRRCRRPLRIEDVLPPHKRHGRHAKEPLQQSDAAQHLKQPLRAFRGVPGRIRKAVDDWAQRGSPALNGEIEKLASSPFLPSIFGGGGLLGGGGGPRPRLPGSVASGWK